MSTSLEDLLRKQAEVRARASREKADRGGQAIGDGPARPFVNPDTLAHLTERAAEEPAEPDPPQISQVAKSESVDAAPAPPELSDRRTIPDPVALVKRIAADGYWLESRLRAWTDRDWTDSREALDALFLAANLARVRLGREPLSAEAAAGMLDALAALPEAPDSTSGKTLLEVALKRPPPPPKVRRHRSADVRYPTVLTQGRSGFGREAHHLPPLIGRRSGGAVQYSLLPGLGPDYDEYGGEFLASVLPVELYTTRGKGAPLDIRMGLEAIFDALGRGRAGGRVPAVPWRHLLERIYPGAKVSGYARRAWPGLNRALDLLEKGNRWSLPIANGKGGWERWRVVVPAPRPLTGHPSERIGWTVTVPDTINPALGSIHNRHIIQAAGAVSTQRLALTSGLPVLWDRPGDLRREVRGEWQQVDNPAAYPLLSLRSVVSLMYPGGVPGRKRWRELEDEARNLLDWLATVGYATWTTEPGGRRIMPGADWPGWTAEQRKLIEAPR